MKAYIPGADFGELNPAAVEPRFVLLAENLEGAARKIEGKLVRKEKIGGFLIGKIFLPKEKFTRPPTEEECKKHSFAGDSLVYDLNGFSLEFLAEEIAEDEKGYSIEVVEVPLVKPSL